MMPVTDVAIIGAGPAGVSTAIQLRRYGVDFIVLEKERIGGLLIHANRIENYPGFPEGIPGPDLVRRLERHLENSGAHVSFQEVLELDHDGSVFTIRTNNDLLASRIAVIASGTVPRRLTQAVSKEIENRIFYETFPLTQVSGKKIAVIGSGDAAFDYALSLSQKNDVLILNRGDKIKCLPLLWRRVRAVSTISYLENFKVTAINQAGDGLLLCGRSSHEKRDIRASFLVVAIGRRPNLDFLSQNLKNNLKKLRKARLLYIAGDVKNGIFRQAAISAGDGIKAAMEIFRKKKEAQSCA
ncbi:MAG: NAD(P)/FAD-dependent oxidoreductase [Clostridiales bacterium]|nr:NAD(P)/FAD-dependent oxidoreductase [Clostridiales bacterium]